MRPSRLTVAVAALVLWASAAWQPRIEPPRPRAGHAPAQVQLLAVSAPVAIAHVRPHARLDLAPSSPAVASRADDHAAVRAIAVGAIAAPHVRQISPIARGPRAPRGPPLAMT